MKRRVIRIVLTGAVVVAVVVLLWPRGEREPEYQGKKLSEWIRGADQIWDESAGGGAERAEAVRRIGTNALPFLVGWIRQETPPSANKVDDAIRSVNRRMWDTWLALRYRNSSRANESVWAFKALGSQGSPAIPELVQVLRSTNFFAAACALHALDGIGKEAMPVLLGLLTNWQAYGASPGLTLVGTMRGLGTNSVLVVPVLVECLTNGDAGIAATAANLLGGIAADPDRVVPALARCLEHPLVHVRWSAVCALRDFKEKGRPALPFLLRALEDSSRSVRAEATNTIRVVAPEVLRKGGVSGERN